MPLSVAFLASAQTLSLETQREYARPLCPGRNIFYTIIVPSLTGGLAFVNDPIPANTTYVTGSSSGGATFDTFAHRSSWQGVLLPGGRVPHRVFCHRESGRPKRHRDHQHGHGHFRRRRLSHATHRDGHSKLLYPHPSANPAAPTEPPFTATRTATGTSTSTRTKNATRTASPLPTEPPTPTSPPPPITVIATKTNAASLRGGSRAGK